MKKSSTGKNKKSRKLLTKKERRAIALRNLKKAPNRKIDWLKLHKYKVNRLNGMNRYRAAIDAGWSESTAKHSGARIDRLANIGIMQALEDAGATNRQVAREIVRLAFTAMKRVPCTVEVREDGEITIDEHAAQWVPDEHLRKETLELITKLKKQLGSGSIIPEGNYKRLIIEVEKESEDDIDSGTRRKDTIDIQAKSSLEIIEV